MTYQTSWRGLTFHDTVPRGTITARAYLENCLATIAEREPVVQAFVSLNIEGARTAADASTKRHAEGRPLSALDGMPIAIKDLIETADMPTQMGCRAYEGNFPKRDSAMIQALREAGAIILAKSVTTELGMSEPGPTTNPWNAAHTPGGSSSGSAAAVAAGFVPVAIGTQVAGSIIRPAAYCGNWALKPTQGGVHRGERQGTSQSTAGPHANCAQDMWLTAREISNRVGGDPGTPGIQGPNTTPEPQRPLRLAVMRTECWERIDPESRAAFDALVRALGVEIVWPEDHPLLAAFEARLGNAMAIGTQITGFENRWAFRNLDRGRVSNRLLERLDLSGNWSTEDYTLALAERAAMRAAHTAIAALADAVIAPACPGPAPVWNPRANGADDNPRPTGDPSCNAASSALGAPAVTVPVLAVRGLPMGVQVMGQPHQDAKMVAVAQWLHKTSLNI